MKTFDLPLNTVVSHADLNDALFCKLQKSKAILTAIMFAGERIESNTVYGALWAVDDYLEEIEALLLRFNHSLVSKVQ